MSSQLQNSKKQNELHIISIIRSSRKNVKDSSHLKYVNNNIKNIRKKSQNKSKELSASSTLSTFRKAMNFHNSCNSLSHTRTKTTNAKPAVNINTNNNEINIHLSLNSENGNYNSSSHYENIMKEKDALISKLQSELENNQKILYKIKKNISINKHSRHNNSHSDLNYFLTKTKSSGCISSKASNMQTVTLFNNLINKRVRSPNVFDAERSKRNLNGQLGRLRTFSAKTQRIFKRNNEKKDPSNGKNIMSNESLVNICKVVIERTRRICEKYNEICENK